MRRLIFISLLLCFAASSSLAQTTQVTGQVLDANGIPYAGAQMKAQLVFAGTPVSNPTVTISVLSQCRANGFGSAPCQVPFTPSNGPFNLDSGGNIPGGGITLQDNTLVAPGGTTWAFTVNTAGNPPPLGTGPQTCSATLTITGASQSISASFAACPKLSNSSGGGGAGTQVLINQSVDPFNRTGATIGGSWTACNNNFSTTPGSAIGNSGTGNAVAQYTGLASVPTQTSRISIGVLNGATDFIGAAVRISGTCGTSISYYICDENSTTLQLQKVVGASNASNGTVTLLGSQAITGATGDNLTLSVVGNTLSCTRNQTGNPVLEANDGSSPLTSGLPGIAQNGTVGSISSFTFISAGSPGGAVENIIFDGDSIIASNGQGTANTDPATSFLYISKAPAYVTNLGVNGKCVGVGCAASTSGTIESMLSTGTSVIDTLVVPGITNTCVLMGGTNDIAVAGRTPAQVYTDITTWITNRHTSGCKAVVVPQVSRTASINTANDIKEGILTSLILANTGGADAVVVLPNSLVSTGASLNTTLFNADQIHLSEISHVEILARAFSAVLSKF